MKPVLVLDIVPYVRNGKQMFAFNQAALHLSAAQLAAKGILNPFTLQNKSLMVEFYKKGEILINGQAVTEDGRIIKNFAAELDMEVERTVAVDLRKQQVTSWRSQFIAGVGGGDNPSGSGQEGTMNSGDQGRGFNQQGFEPQSSSRQAESLDRSERRTTGAIAGGQEQYRNEAGSGHQSAGTTQQTAGANPSTMGAEDTNYQGGNTQGGNDGVQGARDNQTAGGDSGNAGQ